MARCCWWLVLLFGLAGCGGGDSQSRDIREMDTGASPPDLSDIVVYAADSPYREVLTGCATASREQLCTMAILPLLGQDVAVPTVADIMGRVLVSHSWMAERFQQVLERLPADIRLLMRGVSAIVIDSDIRPSFYSRNTAAIYLDPGNLWLTNEEKATVSQTSDFRSDYGDGLKFEIFWRYVKDNAYAYDYYPLTGTETRQIEDILFPMARLLYHELAHANDALPVARIAGLDRQWTPGAAAESLASENVAAGLKAYRPLTSVVWGDLARVLYFGAPLTDELAAVSAEGAGSDFASDWANDPYGYATGHEDVAMLFEETMMKYHFDIDRDVAFASLPAGTSNYCSDYLVKWGVRNRLGTSAVKERAAFVVDQLLPDEDLSAFLGGLPEPTTMMIDRDWCQNLVLGAQQFQVERSQTGTRLLPERDRLPPE